jgi:hypothetical protein
MPRYDSCSNYDPFVSIPTVFLTALRANTHPLGFQSVGNLVFHNDQSSFVKAGLAYIYNDARTFPSSCSPIVTYGSKTNLHVLQSTARVIRFFRENQLTPVTRTLTTAITNYSPSSATTRLGTTLYTFGAISWLTVLVP